MRVCVKAGQVTAHFSVAELPLQPSNHAAQLRHRSLMRGQLLPQRLQLDTLQRGAGMYVVGGQSTAFPCNSLAAYLQCHQKEALLQAELIHTEASKRTLPQPLP